LKQVCAASLGRASLKIAAGSKVAPPEQTKPLPQRLNSAVAATGRLGSTKLPALPARLLPQRKTGRAARAHSAGSAQA